jgi:hypothetical protein
MGKGKPWKSGGGTKKKFGGNDLPSCRGHGIIMATCDTAREREASNELVNLINNFCEEMYPEIIDTDIPPTEEKLSIEELIRREVEAVKDTSKNYAIQKAISIQTGVKGIVLVKLTHKSHCPRQIVNKIFEKIFF